MAYTTRTPLMVRKQSGGMFSIEDSSETTGARFYVGSTVSAGSDAAGYGRNPDAPFSTLAYCLNTASVLTASAGDVVYVMPGHAETISGAAGLNFATAGIKVKGLGWGDIRPKFSLSAQASTVQCNADDMWLENLIFQGTYAGGVTAGLDIKTGCDDLMLKDCVIRAGTDNTTELLKGVTIEATNDRITFDGCHFFEFSGGDATAAIFTEGAFTNLQILNCEFRGDWSTAVLDLDAAAVTTEGLTVRDVFAFSFDPDGGLFVTLDNTTIACFENVTFLGGKSNTPPLAANDDGATYIANCLGTETKSTYAVTWPLTATNYGA